MSSSHGRLLAVPLRFGRGQLSLPSPKRRSRPWRRRCVRRRSGAAGGSCCCGGGALTRVMSPEVLAAPAQLAAQALVEGAPGGLDQPHDGVVAADAHRVLGLERGALLAV